MGFTPFGEDIQKQYQQKYGTPTQPPQNMPSGYTVAPKQKIGGIEIIDNTKQYEQDQKDIKNKVIERTQTNLAPEKINQTVITNNLSEAPYVFKSIEQMDLNLKAMPKSQIGPIAGRLSGLPGINVFQDEYNQVKSSLAATKQTFGKFMEGGVLRAEDEVKYDRIVPSMNDTKPVREYKTQLMKWLMIEKYNTNLKYLLNAGYAGKDLDFMDQVEYPVINKGFKANVKDVDADAKKIESEIKTEFEMLDNNKQDTQNTKIQLTDDQLKKIPKSVLEKMFKK